MSTSIYNIILLFILIIIGYFYISKKTFEGFGDTPAPNTPAPTFRVTNIKNIDTNDLQGNPLIPRNTDGFITSNNNVTLSNSSDNNTNIFISTSGSGWRPINNNRRLINNSNAVIRLGKLHRIKHIVTSGIRSFKLFHSKNGDQFSYEEVFYTSCNNTTNEPSIIFESPQDTGNEVGICNFSDLKTSDNKPVIASYLKLVPIETRTMEVSRHPTGTNRNRDQDTFDSIGMKIEIFGYPNNANPNFTKNPQRSQLTLNDENKRRVILNFQNTLRINSISFTAGSTTEFMSQLTINYKNHETGIEKIIDNINLCTPYKDSIGTIKTVESIIWTYYFDNPIVASELTLIPLTSSNVPGIKIHEVYGSIIDEAEFDAYKEQSKREYCDANDNSNTDGVSNSATELLNQQLEIQQLCDTMEMQDKIKENNQKIQKNRQYLIQLEEQDKKIAALEDVVEKMKHLRLVRENTSDKNMAAEKIKQRNVESQLAQLIEDRNKNMRQLNVTLKLNDSSLNKMNQTVEKLENTNGIGNNTSTTSLEGFTNPIKQKKKNIPQYEYSQGFYYRPYADSTIQTQLVESNEKPSPDLRQFGLAFNSEKVSPMKFYENKVMCTKGCDVNTQFVKMQ